MNIRSASLKEHKAIMEIAKQSPCTRDFSNHMFSSEAAYSKGWIAVAEDSSGSLLGFYCVRHKVREPVTSLYFIGVDKAHHGTGVGQALMRHLVEASRPKIRLNCLKTNMQAQRFYEALGFDKVGVGLGGKADVMELETAEIR